MPYAILVVVQITDVITRLMASRKEGKRWRSAIGIAGFNKKVGLLILIGLVYLIEINLFGTNVVGGVVVTVYIGMELLSNTENLDRIDVYIHTKIRDFIDVLKGKENDNEKD
ncbi:phage holin family protein [Halalkalibacter nanhaiisediminis]|uniref:Toxin secretion/phage lysis holin n=1 Tax=Halalkalibacter nanhaiisediminis TaxID=688079 RepID=A0A562QRD0_9BACI|nr:phage holin family protein [Halalkalibacter nanhaiisediminis]TWI59319.1 toxin secretion/phage lysis holin [Halalkalibacter nanhaiisediminis]